MEEPKIVLRSCVSRLSGSFIPLRRLLVILLYSFTKHECKSEPILPLVKTLIRSLKKP